MKDWICEPNPKVAVSCRPPSSLWRHRSTEKFQSRPKMASSTSQREISRRIYVIHFFVLHRWAKLAGHCAMEPDYFGSFKQSRWLSIFVVHKIQLRLRCIMESVNGSLSTNIMGFYICKFWKLNCQFNVINIIDYLKSIWHNQQVVCMYDIYTFRL